MKRREEIEKVASKLLADFGAIAPPVAVEQIATFYGIQVVRTAAEWSEAGFLLRDHSRTMIGVNSRNSPKRQRFTVAHELGHWQLHTGQPLIVDQSVLINKRNDVSSQATDGQEIEANKFAAGLLMPENLVKDSLRELMGSNPGSREELITRLAKEFDVSNDAMGWRLINLGLLSG